MKSLIRVIETCKDTEDRLSDKGTKKFRIDALEQENKLINIYGDVKYQAIEGFGGAFTEASCTTLDKLTPKQRKQILTAYFHKVKGIGYNFCRTHINSCDYALEEYTYDDVEGDLELKNFSIERDTKSLIPMIRDAFAIAPDMKLFASPWSPPAWMKTNQEMINGGKLKKECCGVWAGYIAKYIKEYQNQNIDIWGITVQNEAKAVQPWESCVYTAEEERDFVRDYLGPILRENGLGDIKIIIWDHNKERIVERSQITFGDPAAAEYIDGIGVHYYSGDHFEALNITHELFPGKHIYGTEACTRQNLENPWLSGERYAHDIIGNFNNWSCAWTDWNLLLDENTGPSHWREKQIAMGDKGVYWFGNSPIMADTRTGEITYGAAYYYMGHFSKFVKRGARRIGLSTYTPDIEAIAFENPDGQKVAIIMNKNDADQDFTLRIEGKIADFNAKAHSILTLLF